MFTSAYPSPTITNTVPDLAIPVTRLSHVTHNREEQQIAIKAKDQNIYQFCPTRKLGKAYSWTGYPIGESFRYCGLVETENGTQQQVYQYVSNTESVMPEGYYSWWSALAKLDENNLHPEILIARAFDKCPNYLTAPPSSQYGNREFSGDLYQLLRDYQKMYSPDPDNLTNVYLLVGGTLRYSHEICCIIIVCSECHRQTDPLKGCPPIPLMNQVPAGCQDPIFLPNGLTNALGQVNFNQAAMPQFCPLHLNTWVSWANLTFAFYFDRQVKFLSHGLSVNEIAHDKKRCFKKQPPPVPWVCPNHLPQNNMQGFGI